MNETGKPNEVLLAYADEHLTYEIQMFVGTALFLVNSNKTSDKRIGGVVNNALLESFLIHMRNLIEFLYPQQIKADDVTIEDYLSKKVISDHLPIINKSLILYRERAHKEIAHLTTKRYTKPIEKEWSFMQIGHEILGIFNTILAYFPGEKISTAAISLLSKTIEGFNRSSFTIRQASNTTISK